MVKIDALLSANGSVSSAPEAMWARVMGGEMARAAVSYNVHGFETGGSVRVCAVRDGEAGCDSLLAVGY